MVSATLILMRDSSIHWPALPPAPSPAQPIWESNIDTHFLTSGWRGAWQWPDFLMNHYCASAVTYGWYLPAAGCGDARSSDSRLHFQVAG